VVLTAGDGALITGTGRWIGIAPTAIRCRVVQKTRLDTARIRAARRVIDPIFLDTPLYRCEALEPDLGCTVSIKLETANPVRSFKARGTEVVASLLVDRHRHPIRARIRPRGPVRAPHPQRLAHLPTQYGANDGDQLRTAPGRPDILLIVALSPIITTSRTRQIRARARGTRL